jgi:cob(I)alamin adenosyltransferase
MGTGVVQIYYGEGHGKSTAALGNAICAASNGACVTLIQFLKAKKETDMEYLTRLEPEVKLFRFAKFDAGFDELSEEQKQEEIFSLKNGFNYSKKVISTGACDMVVLDELLGLLDLGIITIEEIVEMLSVKPEEMTIIFTGRVLDDRLRPYVDEIYNIAPEK